MLWAQAKREFGFFYIHNDDFALKAQHRGGDSGGTEDSLVPSSRPLRVIYIAGYGRSGTTLLDMALGQHEQILGAGEITTLSRHVWANNEYCSCGQAAHDCPLWGRVGHQWMKYLSPPLELEKYKTRQDVIESIAGPVRILGRTLTRKNFNAYADETVKLLEAIRSHSGKDIIVDSSKLPGRALAFSRIPEIDLFVIHLVRDGRGVAWSLLRSYDIDVKAGVQKKIEPRSTIHTAGRWIVVNIATEMLRWRLGRKRYIRVRYEDFIDDPAAVLERIGGMTGIDFSDVASALRGGEPIHPAHQIAGNRLRMNKSIRLVQDEAWRRDMPARERAAFGRFGGWLLRRYGYSR